MSVVLKDEHKVYIAGHRGLVGSAIARALERRGHKNWIGKTSAELDLRRESAVEEFFRTERPDFVFLAAAKVGGIGANSTYPVEFLLDNLRIQNNVISVAAKYDVKKLVFLGSSCIYPKEARYPLTEDQLLSGPFEPTNEAYALAKIAGVKLCEYYSKQYKKNFISAMPTNLYGPNDYYHFENSHVIPAVLLKVLKARNEGAKSVRLWGSGQVYREFLHSDDLAEALIICLEKYESPELINIGSETESRIDELCQLICKICGFSGEIQWDPARPDGVVRKVMSSKKVRALGWSPRIKLEEGLRAILPEAERKLMEIMGR